MREIGLWFEQTREFPDVCGPRANIQTIVATKQMIAQSGSVLERNRATVLNRQVRQALSGIHGSICCDRIGRAGCDAGRTTPTTVTVARLEFWRQLISQQDRERAQRPVRLRNHLTRASSPAQTGTDRKRTLENRTVIDVRLGFHAQTRGVLLEFLQMRLQLQMVIRAPGVTGHPANPCSSLGSFGFGMRVRNHQRQHALRRGETRIRIAAPRHARWQVIHARVKPGLEPIGKSFHILSLDLGTGPARRVEPKLERMMLKFGALLIRIHI